MFPRRVNRIGGVYSQIYKTVSGQVKRVLGKQAARPGVKRKIKDITTTAANSVKKLKSGSGVKGKRKPRRWKNKKAAKSRKKKKTVKRKRVRKGKKRTRKGAPKKRKTAVRRRKKRGVKRKNQGRRKNVKKQKSIFD